MEQQNSSTKQHLFSLIVRDTKTTDNKLAAELIDARNKLIGNPNVPYSQLTSFFVSKLGDFSQPEQQMAATCALITVRDHHASFDFFSFILSKLNPEITEKILQTITQLSRKYLSEMPWMPVLDNIFSIIRQLLQVNHLIRASNLLIPVISYIDTGCITNLSSKIINFSFELIQRYPQQLKQIPFPTVLLTLKLLRVYQDISQFNPHNFTDPNNQKLFLNVKHASEKNAPTFANFFGENAETIYRIASRDVFRILFETRTQQYMKFKFSTIFPDNKKNQLDLVITQRCISESLLSYPYLSAMFKILPRMQDQRDLMRKILHPELQIIDRDFLLSDIIHLFLMCNDLQSHYPVEQRVDFLILAIDAAGSIGQKTFKSVISTFVHELLIIDPKRFNEDENYRKFTFNATLPVMGLIKRMVNISILILEEIAMQLRTQDAFQRIRKASYSLIMPPLIGQLQVPYQEIVESLKLPDQLKRELLSYGQGSLERTSSSTGLVPPSVSQFRNSGQLLSSPQGIESIDICAGIIAKYMRTPDFGKAVHNSVKILKSLIPPNHEGIENIFARVDARVCIIYCVEMKQDSSALMRWMAGQVKAISAFDAIKGYDPHNYKDELSRMITEGTFEWTYFFLNCHAFRNDPQLVRLACLYGTPDQIAGISFIPLFTPDCAILLEDKMIPNDVALSLRMLVNGYLGSSKDPWTPLIEWFSQKASQLEQWVLNLFFNTLVMEGETIGGMNFINAAEKGGLPEFKQKVIIKYGEMASFRRIERTRPPIRRP